MGVRCVLLVHSNPGLHKLLSKSQGCNSLFLSEKAKICDYPGKRYVLSILSFCLLVMMLAAQLSHADIADSVYLNGQIYTVNNNSPWAQAVAIKNRRFQYVGSNTGVRKYVGKETQVIDLKGQMAMPGIHDGHQHLMLAGARASHWCKMPEGPIGEAFERELKECASTIDREWLEVGLYTPQQFPDGKPDRNTWINYSRQTGRADGREHFISRW